MQRTEQIYKELKEDEINLYDIFFILGGWKILLSIVLMSLALFSIYASSKSKDTT